ACLIKLRPVALDRTLPLRTNEQARGRGTIRLRSLNASLAVLADPERIARVAQSEVRCVEIGRDKMMGFGFRGLQQLGRVERGQAGMIDLELQLGLDRLTHRQLEPSPFAAWTLKRASGTPRLTRPAIARPRRLALLRAAR